MQKQLVKFIFPANDSIDGIIEYLRPHYDIQKIEKDGVLTVILESYEIMSKQALEFIPEGLVNLGTGLKYEVI